MSARTTTTLDVYKEKLRVGALSRTEHGARFSYAAEYLAKRAHDAPVDVAFAMPPRAEPYDVVGSNLHPFFAGLLPEGLRLRALVRQLKTSEDDLFSMLVASGSDAIGDIAIALPEALPRERAPLADTSQLAQASFAELLEQSLRYEGGGGDVAIAGVQPKISAAMISFPVRAADKRHTYILKLAPPEYPRLIENEAFFMSMAKSVGLDVARTRVVTDRSGQPALLVERFDRVPERDGSQLRLHQEDACQLLNLYPADKYRLTLADVAGALDLCSAPLAEKLKLLRMQAFSYLIVNGDMHAKNISVRVLAGQVLMTPCYDLLSTLPYGDRRLALAMEGRDDRLKRAHFIAFGERVGIRRAAVEGVLDSLCKRASARLPRLGEIGLEPKRQAHLAKVMGERLGELSR
jgi:serine/threonine-protein kinase HipA